MNAALAIAAAIALSACSTPVTSAPYAVDVHWSDLEAGSCIESAWIDDTRTKPFDFDATSFRVVDCADSHVAQVLGRVDVPAADEWALYGTTDGPSQNEADAWLEGVCRSYAVLATHYLGTERAAVVEPVYSTLGRDPLGWCLLYDAGQPLTTVDVDAMLDAGKAAGFDAPYPDGVRGWLVPTLEGDVVFWSDIQPGQCVEPFASPDEEEYAVVPCTEPHAAQAMLWVELKPEWGGVHPGATVAQPYADETCAALSTDPGIAVIASEAAENYLVRDTFIAMCWASRTDGEPLTAPLPG